MKSALFALSADPVTKGHFDIVARALRIVDTVYIATVESTGKKGSLFTFEERNYMLKQVFHMTSTVVLEKPITGMTVDYAKQLGVSALLRGIRDYTDLDYEFKLANMNRLLSTRRGLPIETIFIAADPALSMYSSTTVRELIRLGDDSWKCFVPECIHEYIGHIDTSM